MKKILIFLAVLGALFGGGVYVVSSGILNPTEKLYVAVEGEGKIAVIDPAKGSVIKEISLAKDHEGGIIPYYPHNVQVAPDGATVWVTANAGAPEEKHASSFIPSARAHGEEGSDEFDEIIVINTKNDRIIKRIPAAVGSHLAHIVVTNDGSRAYATAQKENVIYRINGDTYERESSILTKANSAPHGIRLDPNGVFAYLALFGINRLGILNLADGSMVEVELGGSPIQTGVTSNGKYVFASLFDTKKIALYNTQTREVTEIPLPEDAQGPLQVYPSSDNANIFVADQGYYEGKPQGNLLYVLNIQKGEVIKSITVGSAPHGVVASKDGRMVYVSNLASGDVSVVDTTTGTQVKVIPVGKEPNGISLWSKQLGGTP